MNIKKAREIARECYPKLTPRRPTGFAGGAVVMVTSEGSSDVVVVHHPSDLAKLKMMCEMALAAQKMARARLGGDAAALAVLRPSESGSL